MAVLSGDIYASNWIKLQTDKTFLFFIYTYKTYLFIYTISLYDFNPFPLATFSYVDVLLTNND